MIVSVSSSYAHSYVGGFKFPTVTRPDFFFSIGKMLRRGGRSKLVGVQQQQHQRQLLKTSANKKMKGNERERERNDDDGVALPSAESSDSRGRHLGACLAVQQPSQVCVHVYIFDVCCNIPDTSVFFSPLQQQWRPINDGGEFLRISFRLILNYLAPTQRNSNVQNS